MIDKQTLTCYQIANQIVSQLSANVDKVVDARVKYNGGVVEPRYGVSVTFKEVTMTELIGNKLKELLNETNT